MPKYNYREVTNIVNNMCYRCGDTNRVRTIRELFLKSMPPLKLYHVKKKVLCASCVNYLEQNDVDYAVGLMSP